MTKQIKCPHCLDELFTDDFDMSSICGCIYNSYLCKHNNIQVFIVKIRINNKLYELDSNTLRVVECVTVDNYIDKIFVTYLEEDFTHLSLQEITSIVSRKIQCLILK